MMSQIQWEVSMAIEHAKHTCKAVGNQYCDCPTIIYEDKEDGICRHKACEGLQTECGEPIDIATE